MKRWTLKEILAYSGGNDFDFIATYGDDSYTIFTTEYFLQAVITHFHSRYLQLWDEISGVEALAYLKNLFTVWKSNRDESYARRAYALSIEYEPLENYDRMETREGSSDLTHGESIRRTRNDTDRRTLDTVDASVRGGSDTVSNSRYGVNSASAVPTDNSVTAYDSNDRDTHTGTVTDAHTGTVEDAHSGTDHTEDGYTLRAHGNIGVTTAAQMLGEDIAALRYDLALIAVCDFLDEYTQSIDYLEL